MHNNAESIRQPQDILLRLIDKILNVIKTIKILLAVIITWNEEDNIAHASIFPGIFPMKVLSRNSGGKLSAA